MKNFFPLLFTFIVAGTAIPQSASNFICSDCYSLPKVINIPKPVYPTDAAKNGISGKVEVRVKINEHGRVVEAIVIDGPAELRQTSVDSASRASFHPAISVGMPRRPTTSSAHVTFNFVLDEKKEVTPAQTRQIPIVNGAASYLPAPVYPKKADDFCADGQVKVQITVRNGRVITAKPISGDELLRATALAAAKRARFDRNLIPFVGPGILVYTFKPKSKCIVSGVVNARAISLPKPNVYPFTGGRYLRLAAPETVEVQIVVDQTGEVIAARAISGHPLLRSACVRAASNAKFTPAPHLSVRIRASLVYKIYPNGTVEL